MVLLKEKIVQTFYIFTDFQDVTYLSDGYELIKIIETILEENRSDLIIAFLLGDRESKKEIIEIRNRKNK